MALEWDSTLETGDPLVDEQHRRIHDIFHELELAEDTPGEIIRVLDLLAVQVGTHFATEEELMARAAYPRELAEPHRAEHVALTEDTRTIILQFRRGELHSIKPILDFLRDWLSNHVHNRDRQLIDYVRARGGAAVLPKSPASSPLRDDLTP